MAGLPSLESREIVEREADDDSSGSSLGSFGGLALAHSVNDTLAAE